MRFAVVLLVLAIVGCGPKPASQSDTIADLNARDAVRQIEALSARVDELELELADVQDAQALTDANLNSQMEAERADRASDFEDLNAAIANLEAQR